MQEKGGSLPFCQGEGPLREIPAKQKAAKVLPPQPKGEDHEIRTPKSENLNPKTRNPKA